MIGAVLSGAILYFFYKNKWICLLSVPCAIVFLSLYSSILCEKRKKRLQKQFKDWIISVAANLQSGYSMENSFLKSGREIELIYGEESDIQKEVTRMGRLLKNNVNLEEILMDLGNRSGIDDIQNFAITFSTAKRSGGNFKEMIEDICEIISAKVETEVEIETVIAGKVMEQRIMSVVPFAIIVYISISSPGYFDSLYHNSLGVIVMTIGLVIYLFSLYIANRITNIKV